MPVLFFCSIILACPACMQGRHASPFPHPAHAFQIARKALEPPDMLEEDAGEQGIAPAVAPVPMGTLQHWSAVRCGCIEGVLATAILAGQHADVWEAASMLLREHYR